MRRWLRYSCDSLGPVGLGLLDGIPASGTTFELEFADVASFNERGELLEIFDHADRLALLQQRDAIAEPSVR